MTINPYSSPEAPGESAGWRLSWPKPTLVEVLVVVFIIGMLVALLIPARRGGAVNAALRSRCNNNLTQIALALHNYEEVHHALPPAYTVDAEGKPLHSWRTLILPFMEQQALYETIDLSKPWDDPANKAAFEFSLDLYRCPSADCPATHTTYLAVVAPGGCFRPTEPRELSEITDDHNLTLMVMEVAAEHAVHWMSPTDASEQRILELGTAARLPHRGGAQAVCVSGNTRFLSADSKAAELRALISIAGNDDAIADGAN